MSGAVETEYKFLVKQGAWQAQPAAQVLHITQHYLPDSAEGILRLTLRQQDSGAMIIAAGAGKQIPLAVPDAIARAFGDDNLRLLAGAGGSITVDDSLEARIRQADEDYLLTIKAKTRNAASRLELEFPITEAAAQALIPHCPHKLEKIRHVLLVGEDKWEVDVYQGKNHGLVTAEIETEEKPSTLPDWIAQDITSDKKYSNRQLARIPYTQWGRDADAACAVR